MTVLLVTGSRAFHDQGGAAELWAKKEITGAIDALGKGGLVVAGDARGPDTWAQRHANRTGKDWLRFALNGRVSLTRWVDDEGGRNGWDWWQGTDLERLDYGNKWPLLRNRVMVEYCASFVSVSGDEVVCLALIHPASQTRGTGHTADLARMHGFTVLELTWRG